MEETIITGDHVFRRRPKLISFSSNDATETMKIIYVRRHQIWIYVYFCGIFAIYSLQLFVTRQDWQMTFEPNANFLMENSSKIVKKFEKKFRKNSTIFSMNKYVETSYSTMDENYLMFPDEHDEEGTRMENDRILEQIAFTPKPVSGKIFRIYLRQDYRTWGVDLG